MAAQSVGLQDQRPEGEQHVANLFGGAPGQFLNARQFRRNLIGPFFEEHLHIVQPHGDGGDGLSGAIMQVAGQFLRASSSTATMRSFSSIRL